MSSSFGKDYVNSDPEMSRLNNLQKIAQLTDHPERRFPFEHNYFENRDCIFFPCHSVDIEKHGFNCLFCTCPYYYKATCPGIDAGDAVILENGAKDCTNCSYNHCHENRIEMSLVHLSKSEM